MPREAHHPHRRQALGCGVCLLLLAAAPTARAQIASPGPAPEGQQAQTALDTLLDGTYRIDIDTISATLDWYPASGWVDATATLTFRLRPGQSRAAFNFTPFATARSAVSRLVVDGRAFNLQSNDDVRVIQVAGTRQPFVEIRYDLEPGALHVMTVDYRLTIPAVYPRLSSEVNDLRGEGNEAVWPTLNTPHELARHVLTFRVHDSRPFRFVGSGRAESSAGGGVQQWVLDTQRSVSSYSVMFVLLPAADTQYQEWLIDRVPVRLLAYTDVDLAAAKSQLDAWLPELRARFGAFPALHGLSVFLYDNSGGGMEYYGGTVTSLSALRHEVLHSYFGCSVVTRTYPDSWLDEAITTWIEETSRGVPHAVLPDGYHGNWVGARSPVSVGFSSLAYTHGASIMQAIANRLGGTDGMTDFLRVLVETRSFSPFTTMEFVTAVATFSGVDMRLSFLDWLYNGREPDSTYSASLAPVESRKVLSQDPSWVREARR